MSVWSQCPFTYVGLVLSTLYLVALVWAQYYVFKISRVARRKSQKLYLLLVCILCIMRIAYFISWPVYISKNEECTPDVSQSYSLIMDILGNFPVCLFISAFSLYILTFARIHKQFQLHYLRWPPRKIVLFYRLQTVVFFIINVTIYATNVIQFPLHSKKHENVRWIIDRISIVCIAVGTVILAFFFWVVSLSLRNTISEYLYLDGQCNEKLGMSGGQEGYTSPLQPSSESNIMIDSETSRHHGLIASSRTTGAGVPDASFNKNMNHWFQESRISLYKYHVDMLSSSNNSVHGTTYGGNSYKKNLQFHSAMSVHAMKQRPRSHHNEQDDESTYSFGVQGRVALNPHKNPMSRLVVVASITGIALLGRACMLPQLYTVLSDDTHYSIIQLYIVLSEIAPIYTMLSAFVIAAAPTAQWNNAYGIDVSVASDRALVYATSMYEEYTDKLKRNTTNTLGNVQGNNVAIVIPEYQNPQYHETDQKNNHHSFNQQSMYRGASPTETESPITVPTNFATPKPIVTVNTVNSSPFPMSLTDSSSHLSGAIGKSLVENILFSAQGMNISKSYELPPTSPVSIAAKTYSFGSPVTSGATSLRSYISPNKIKQITDNSFNSMRMDTDTDDHLSQVNPSSSNTELSRMMLSDE